MSRALYLFAVSAMPVFIIWVLGFGLEGGFLTAWKLIGPVLAFIYPPMAVWMTLKFEATKEQQP